MSQSKVTATSMPAVLAVPLLRRRQVPHGPAALRGLLAAMLVSAPVDARAHPNDFQGIDIQQYKPAPSRSDVLDMYSPRVAPHLGWNMGLSLSYARAPLNFVSTNSNGPVYSLVRDQYTFDLMGTIALFDRFELGMALPITSQHSAPSVSLPPQYPQGVHTTDVGDLRLVPKLQLLSTSNGLRLGVAVPLLMPTSGGKGFLGRDDMAVFPRLLGEWTRARGVRVLTNVGVNLQPQKRLYNLAVGNEFAYGLGAEVPFQLGKHRLAAEATLVGAVGLKERDAEECPLELHASLKYRFTNGLAAHIGGGPGITHGYGTPAFRLFAGLMWTGTGARSSRLRRATPAPPGP